MEVIGQLMDATLNVFQIEFNIYGYTISLWQVFLFTAVTGIIGWAIGRIFGD